MAVVGISDRIVFWVIQEVVGRRLLLLRLVKIKPILLHLPLHARRSGKRKETKMLYNNRFPAKQMTLAALLKKKLCVQVACLANLGRRGPRCENGARLRYGKRIDPTFFAYLLDVEESF